MNPQFSEYVQDGNLICFGISEHLGEERLPEWTEKAKNDMKMVSELNLTRHRSNKCLL